MVTWCPSYVSRQTNIAILCVVCYLAINREAICILVLYTILMNLCRYSAYIPVSTLSTCIAATGITQPT